MWQAGCVLTQELVSVTPGSSPASERREGWGAEDSAPGLPGAQGRLRAPPGPVCPPARGVTSALLPAQVQHIHSVSRSLLGVSGRGPQLSGSAQSNAAGVCYPTARPSLAAGQREAWLSWRLAHGIAGEGPRTGGGLSAKAALFLRRYANDSP